MTDQAQVQGFDVNDLDATTGPATHKVSVIDDIEGNPVSGFIIVGKNSKECQEATKQNRINNIKRASKRKQQIDAASDIGAAVIAKTVEEGDRTMALSVVIGWFGMLSGGELIKFDKKIVEKMFDKYPTWQAKVLAALEDDANFLKA